MTNKLPSSCYVGLWLAELVLPERSLWIDCASFGRYGLVVRSKSRNCLVVTLV